MRFLSPTRIVKGLHSGAAVVSERFDESEIAPLYRYTVACDYEQVAERCIAVIRSRAFVDIGMAALARFQAETSMRENMAEALELPVFERLARESAR